MTDFSKINILTLLSNEYTFLALKKNNILHTYRKNEDFISVPKTKITDFVQNNCFKEPTIAFKTFRLIFFIHFSK